MCMPKIPAPQQVAAAPPPPNTPPNAPALGSDAEASGDLTSLRNSRRGRSSLVITPNPAAAALGGSSGLNIPT